MPEAKKIPFLKLFSAWRPEADLLPLVGGWLVTGAVIDKGTRRISARVECPRLPADALKARLEDRLAFAYRVERVELALSAPAQQAA